MTEIPNNLLAYNILRSNDTNKIYESMYVELSKTKIQELNIKNNILENSESIFEEDIKIPHFIKMVDPLNSNKKLINKIYTNLAKDDYEICKSKIFALKKKKMRILIVGPKQSGKSSFIKTFTHYKSSYRKVLKKGDFKITILKQIIKNVEYKFEFIDTNGYNKNEKNWYIPIEKMIKTRFKKSYEAKKLTKNMIFGIDKKNKYDFNVILTRDTYDVIFYKR